MTFSYEIKEELSKIINFKDKEILEAEFLGYILTGNTNMVDNKIEYITENEFNIEAFYKILFNLNIEYEPAVKGKYYVAVISIDEKFNEYLKLINSKKEEILKAIVKGAFFFFF